MHKHKVDDQKYLKNKSNIEFAKELFSIWDEDESGKLEIDELTLPLIALGLSTDSNFIKKLLSVSDKNNFGKHD